MLFRSVAASLGIGGGGQEEAITLVADFAAALTDALRRSPGRYGTRRIFGPAAPTGGRIIQTPEGAGETRIFDK